MRFLWLTWLGQAGFLLEEPGGRKLLVDPFLSDHPGRLYPPPVEATRLVGVNVVLATHEHDDHLDLPFLRALLEAGGRPRVLVPEPVRPLALAGGLPAERVEGVAPGAWREVEGFRVRPLPALHGVGGPGWSGAYDFGGPPERPRFLGYVVEAGGVRLFHAGDGLVYPGLAEAVAGLRADVALLPVNGRDAYRESAGIVGNMDEREAARLALEAGVRLLVPMHYEAFRGNEGDVGRLARAVAAQGGPALLLPVRGERTLLTFDGEAAGEGGEGRAAEAAMRSGAFGAQRSHA